MIKFKRTKEVYEISLIPMINVVFFILIFFLIAGTIKANIAKEIELPKAADEASGKALDNVDLLIAKNGSLKLDGNKIFRKYLGRELKMLREQKNPKKLTILADKNYDARKLLDLMGKIEQHEFHNIAIVTEIK